MHVIEDADLKIVADMFDGDPDILTQIVKAFLEEVPKLITKAHQSLQDRDAEQFSRSVHSLKSTMRVFGVPNSVALAEELEQTSREGDLGLPDQSFAELSKQIDHMIGQLNHFIESGSDG